MTDAAQELSQVEVSSCGWHEVLGKSLAKLWEEQTGCDFTFVCRGGKELQAHSSVLQAVSVHLKQWMASCWSHKEFVYHMEAVTSDVLLLVLRFIYHGKLYVPLTRLQDVKAVAEVLKINELLVACSEHQVNRSSTSAEDSGHVGGGNYIWPHKKARKYKMLEGGKDKGLEDGFSSAMDPTADPTTTVPSEVGSDHLLSGLTHPPHTTMMAPVFSNSQALPFGTPGHSAFAIPPRPGPSHNMVVNLSSQRETVQHDSSQRLPVKPNNHGNMAQSGAYNMQAVNQGSSQDTMATNPQGHAVLHLGNQLIDSSTGHQQPPEGSSIHRNLQPPSLPVPPSGGAGRHQPMAQTSHRPPEPTYEMRDLWNSVDLNFSQQQMTTEDLSALTEMPNTVDHITSHPAQTCKTKLKKVTVAKEVLAKDKQSKTRKRASHPETWKKNIRKVRKARGLAYISSRGKLVQGKSRTGPPCSCRMRCSDKITEEECNQIFIAFFALGDKNMQDAVLFGLVEREDTKRKKTTNIVRQRSNTFLYYARKKDGMVINVCREAFMSIYGVTCKCLRRLQEHVARGNIAPPLDMRGKVIKKEPTDSLVTNENIAPSVPKSKPDQIPLPQETPS